jgi:hypothetical protein
VLDLTGRTFGRLTVKSRAANKGHGSRWHCECECGRKTVVFGWVLTAELTKSCGCLRNKTNGSLSPTLQRAVDFLKGELSDGQDRSAARLLAKGMGQGHCKTNLYLAAKKLNATRRRCLLRGQQMTTWKIPVGARARLKPQPRSGSVPDGPSRPDRLIVNGQVYNGFPPYPFRLLEFLWGRGPVPIQEVIDHLYGSAGESKDPAFIALKKKLARLLAKNNCPLEISVRAGEVFLSS